jgi:hypothetical protein
MTKLCINCAKHARCVSLGWMSPSGFWFADQVVIRPQPGCQLHDVGGTEVMRYLGIAMERPEDPTPAEDPDKKAAE